MLDTGTVRNAEVQFEIPMLATYSRVSSSARLRLACPTGSFICVDELVHQRSERNTFFRRIDQHDAHDLCRIQDGKTPHDGNAERLADQHERDCKVRPLSVSSVRSALIDRRSNHRSATGNIDTSLIDTNLPHRQCKTVSAL